MWSTDSVAHWDWTFRTYHVYFSPAYDEKLCCGSAQSACGMCRVFSKNCSSLNTRKLLFTKIKEFEWEEFSSKINIWNRSCKNKTLCTEEEDLCLEMFHMRCFRYSLTPLRSPAHYQLSDPILSMPCMCVCACVLHERVCACVYADSFEDMSVCMNTNTIYWGLELTAASSWCLPHTSGGPQQQLSLTHAQLQSYKGLWSWIPKMQFRHFWIFGRTVALITHVPVV